MISAVSPDDYNVPATPESTSGSMSVVPPAVKVEATITPDLLMTPGLTPEYHRPEKQPVRKRKSWGQVLPEPKTSLPPRKRAKTADEKEQRRIERVKRNRLAAHNSRERKREEMEVLQMHNDALVAKIQQLETELAAFRNGKTPSVPSFDFPKTTTTTTTTMVSLSPAPTAVPDVLLQPTPELGNLSSPATELYSQPSTPVPEAFTPPAEEVSFVDPTQQSAVLLCDLQCRSTTPTSNSPSSVTSRATPSSQQTLLAMTALQIYWLNLQLFLSNLSTLSSTLITSSPRTRSPQALFLFAARTYSMTMLARLRNISTSSPTQARDLLQEVATSLASSVSGSRTMSRSSSVSKRSRREERQALARSRRRRERQERYQASEARRSTSAWLAQREVKLACDTIARRHGSADSAVAVARIAQKLRAYGTRR